MSESPDLRLQELIPDVKRIKVSKACWMLAYLRSYTFDASMSQTLGDKEQVV
jgi:hypothetical protein